MRNLFMTALVTVFMLMSESVEKRAVGEKGPEN